ncbi:MAG: J domain-containing protein [Myxococcota bacterium]
MIDLRTTAEGELGERTRKWFSSLLLAALQAEFTGVTLIRFSSGSGVVFFNQGQPVHASGDGFDDHHLGQVLIDRGICSHDVVSRALKEQQDASTKPLLGALLVRDGIDANEIKRSVQVQTKARLSTLIGLAEAQWQAAEGQDPRIREIGVALDGWTLFFDLLEKSPSRRELTTQMDAWLGSSIRVQKESLPSREWSTEERKLLNLLKKPRKPDQMERALGIPRSFVRGFLRALNLLNVVEVGPVKKAIAIPNTVKGIPTVPAASESPAAGRAKNPNHVEVVRPPPSRKAPHPLLGEIDRFHGDMKEKNHFELLGVAESASTGDIRKSFTDLAKKFHPDAWPSDLDQDAAVAEKAREISARLNDAYEITTNAEKKSEYLEMLRDERIRGDYRKREQLRDAEVKAKMGVVYLRKKDFHTARSVFKFAHETDPSCGLYQAYLAWSQFADPKSDQRALAEETFRALTEALKKEQDLPPEKQSPIIHMYMGTVLKTLARERDAIFHFKQVLKHSPKHIDALREVRILEKRMEDNRSKKGSSGLLGGLFGRKSDDR